MRSILICLVFLAIFAISAHCDTLSMDEKSCWACPICGSVYQLDVSVPNTAQYYQTTLGSIKSLDPEDPSWYCPTCYYTMGLAIFAGNFVLVPCTESQADYDTEYNYDTVDNNVSAGPEPPQSENISGNQLAGNVLMVVAPKNYQEIELNIPKKVFESSGLQVDVASKGVDNAISMGGECAAIDVDIGNIDLSNYRAIVFVGGIGIEELKIYQDKDYVNLAKDAAARGMIVSAICLAPNILASAGLLTNKNATAADSTYLVQKNANYVDLPVVRDGNIITGRDPDASQEFAETILSAISELS